MKLFHKHSWKLISAANETGSDFNMHIAKFVETWRETVIIDMCTECKHFRTRRLQGHHATLITKGYGEINEKA